MDKIFVENKSDINQLVEVVDGDLKKLGANIIKYILEQSDVLGCSAEGHISHVLSERMSSRPLGWSEKGAEQMSRLRAFKYNGGNKKKIYEILKRKVKVKKLKIKTEKILNRKKKRNLYPEAKEIIPALSKGKRTGLFRAVKSLAY